MKRKIIYLVVTLIITINITFSQEKASYVTGDNFSLEGALALFKNSNSLEDFEKLLNEENNNVNNLDLNDDSEIDYIIVNHIKENDTHIIVLSTYLNEKEKQDIATIGIEKNGDESAILQIQGDEELYAANTIIEPFDIEEKAINSKKGGPSSPQIFTTRILVNVWFWPSVRFIYNTRYVAWESPYRWNKYPIYWKPWKPYRHSIFYGRTAPHRVYYKRTPTQRVVVARKVYMPKRKTTTIVVHKNRKTTIVNKNRRSNIKVRPSRKNPNRRRTQ